MKSLIILTLSLFTWTASAEVFFKSYEQLREAFFKGGIDTIIDIPGSSVRSDTIFVFTPETKNEKGMGLRKFAKMTDSMVRVPALDYVVATPLLANISIAEAIVIADKFLCYKYREGWFARPVGGDDFIRCLTFPQSVSEVLKSVRLVRD